MASAPEGDSTLHKYATTTPQPTPQPTPQAVPPAYTAPQVPNIHASGSINPTAEQVQRRSHKQTNKRTDGFIFRFLLLCPAIQNGIVCTCPNKPNKMKCDSVLSQWFTNLTYFVRHSLHFLFIDTTCLVLNIYLGVIFYSGCYFTLLLVKLVFSYDLICSVKVVLAKLLFIVLPPFGGAETRQQVNH